MKTHPSRRGPPIRPEPDPREASPLPEGPRGPKSGASESDVRGRTEALLAPAHFASDLGLGKPTQDRARAAALARAPDDSIGATPGLQTSGPLGAKQSFERLLDDLWARRADLELQPKATVVYRLAGLEAPDESNLPLMPFLAGLRAVLDRLPPFVEAGHRCFGSSRKDVSGGLSAAVSKQLDGPTLSKLEWGRFRLFARDFDAEAPHDRIYLNTKPEAALSWAKWLAEEVLAKPERFPGVSVVEFTGPGGTTRADDVTVLVAGEAARTAVLGAILAEAQRRPGTLETEVVPGTEPVRGGVSWGEEPDLSRYPGESFRSVRAKVLFGALLDVLGEGGGREQLSAMVRDRMVEAGLDPKAPHKNLCGPPPVAEVLPLDHAEPPLAGIYSVVVDAFGQKVTVEVEVTPEAAASLARQKRLAFLPSLGAVGFPETDRTRDPPRKVLRELFSLTHAADQRYKIEHGEAGPQLLAFDEKTKEFYVPARVKIVKGSATRPFSAVPEGQACARRRPAEPTLPLVRRFLARGRPDDLSRTAAARIEAYLSDPDAKVVSSVPLEEGVNGKAIVRLDNGAVALWKPSGAEYPEPMRAHLGPDHFARREAFAYEVSRALGHLARVPPAVYRELNGQPGALVALIRGSESGMFSDRLAALLEDPEDEDHRALAVFDHVIGSLDRHRGNVLFAEGRAIAIDHGLCLPRRHGEQGGHEFLFGTPLSLKPEEIERLDRLCAQRPALDARAAELGIHPKALALMWERVERMREKGVLSSRWRKAGP